MGGLLVSFVFWLMATGKFNDYEKSYWLEASTAPVNFPIRVYLISDDMIQLEYEA